MKVERRLFHAFELSALAFVDHVGIKPFAQHHTVHPLRDTVERGRRVERRDRRPADRGDDPGGHMPYHASDQPQA